LLQVTWSFQHQDPVREARFTLQTPPGWEYNVHWLNHVEIPAQQDAPNQSHFAVQDVPGVDIEDDAPPAEALEAHAILNFAPTDPALRQKTLDSWNEFGLWDNRLTAGRRDDSPEIEATVKDLTASATTPVDKMRAITLWVQKQIRYYAVEIGVGGLQQLVFGRFADQINERQVEVLRVGFIITSRIDPVARQERIAEPHVPPLRQRDRLVELRERNDALADKKIAESAV